MKPGELKPAIDRSIEKHAFSGVVGIRRNGKVLYERAAGYADRSNRIANTPETRFGIASGTKFFTALAIGKLIEDGKLSFSTRAKECINLDFPQYSDEITIEHLLTHTSGIPDYYDEENITDYNNFSVGVPWYELRGPRDYLAVFPKGEMKFEPGRRFSYSNGGYIILGIIIEELSGETYQKFVEQEIFTPIGMTRSGYFAMNKLPENTAFGYIEEEDGWRTNVFNLPIVGASDGGAYTTLYDLAKLWDAFWGCKILSKEMVELYVRPNVKAETEGQNKYYGRGIWIYHENEQEPREYIEGCDAGVSFKSSTMRANDLQVTVISNTTRGAWPVLKEIDEMIRKA
ncbi:MAG: beta-lactamase family protein [Candidatus Eisenbacteria bacterium]|uniref:Beta-lactamase family protein n=1 Tax=Eiseniibacteriota bacterium TaxID=2212470 RepID=A0A948W4F6_UNCEI|nr:beta-lactamase family protein [Candidatus Eisenbacteria bacterium]MBU1947823.1 beta-lactamase family protein [Candidatus Eisenbacteria bacterium]MBU2689304.1 beta-lactamase family protein [Candidatus Eisenbacteria bacterium]